MTWTLYDDNFGSQVITHLLINDCLRFFPLNTTTSVFSPKPEQTAMTTATAVEDSPVTRRLQSIKHIILVLAGKGGVGKSSVATQLALNLYNSSPNARIGILDVDLTGPSIPRMFGVDGPQYAVHQSTTGWVPVYADAEAGEQRLAVMSVGLLLKKKGDSVVWRGPKKNGMIRQFLSDVRWGELDYLIIDTPPGTSGS